MRTIKFDNIENFRDLGGYPCSYGETSFGVIYRSATLGHASAEDVERMAEVGIKTVIDLREDSVKGTLKNPVIGDARFRYVSLPVNGNGRIPTSFEDQIDSYFEMLEEPYSARKIFQTILYAEKPLVFHCNAGKDRTGAFAMILLLLQGVPLEDVNADYLLSFPLLPKMSANTRKAHPEYEEILLTPNLSFLPTFYERFLERYGSLEEYFAAIGMSEDEYLALSSLLGKQETSCGVVLFSSGKTLVEHMALGHYSLVKGHVEATDRSEEDTARRELKEEVGLEVASFLDGFRHVIFYSPRPGVLKKVVFFAGEAKPGTIALQKEEVQDAYWLKPEDALIALSHDSDRAVLREACKAYFRSNR